MNSVIESELPSVNENPNHDPTPLVSRLYEIAGPRLGSKLVEANVVVTLAGLRYQTEFFLSNPIPEDLAQIELLNSDLSEKDIKFKAHNKIIKSASNGQDLIMVSLVSLPGLAFSSTRHSIFPVPPFSLSSGWPGQVDWSRRTLASIDTWLSTQPPTYTEYKADIFAGIHKGYPDQAVVDLLVWLISNRQLRTITSPMPQAQIYGGAQPLFMYLPEHSSHPDIVETTSLWSKTLADFYASPWHQQLAQNPDFLAARNQVKP